MAKVVMILEDTDDGGFTVNVSFEPAPVEGQDSPAQAAAALLLDALQEEVIIEDIQVTPTKTFSDH